MPDQSNIVLHAEGKPEIVIETNLNLMPAARETLYAQVWACPDPYPFGVNNKLLKTFYGDHCLTDAVLYLSELLDEPVAHKLKKKGSEVWL